MYVTSIIPSKLLVEVLSLMILFDSYQKCICRLENGLIKTPGPYSKKKKKKKKDHGGNAPVPDIGEVFRASNSRVLHLFTEPSQFTSCSNSFIPCTHSNFFS